MNIQHSSNFRDPLIREAVALQEKLFEKIKESSSDPHAVECAFRVLNQMAICWDDDKESKYRLLASRKMEEKV